MNNSTGSTKRVISNTQDYIKWCHNAFPSMYISRTKFEEHCSWPIFLEIFLIECCTVLEKTPMMSSLSSFAYYKNIHISKTKKASQKGKRVSSLLWKAFQISGNYFLLQRHFYKLRLDTKMANTSILRMLHCMYLALNVLVNHFSSAWYKNSKTW